MTDQKYQGQPLRNSGVGSSEIVGPLRRWKLRLEIGADTMADLRSALKGVSLDLFVNHCQSATGGGGGAGWHFDLVEQAPDMTPERYADELEKYLESLKRPNEKADSPDKKI